MILHTISAPPSSSAFSEALSIATADDAILLVGDSVYAALPESAHPRQLRGTQAALFILASDALAAGIKEPAADIQTVTMDGFVALSEQFPRQMAWF